MYNYRIIDTFCDLGVVVGVLDIKYASKLAFILTNWLCKDKWEQIIKTIK